MDSKKGCGNLGVVSVAAVYLCVGLVLSPFILKYLPDNNLTKPFKDEIVQETVIKTQIYVSKPTPKPSIVPIGIPEAKYDIATEDLYCMAHGIYLEARDQSVEGQIQVGYVIKNRVESNSHGWPDNVCGVVYKRKAFSFTLDKPYINLGNEAERKAYIRAIRVAKGVLDGTFEDKTKGATHYYALKGMKGKKEPWWANSYKVVNVVGDHTFLK